MPLTLMKGLVPHLYFNVLWREREGELYASSLARLEHWLDKHGGLKSSFPLVLTYVPRWMISHSGCKQHQKRIEAGMKENVTKLREKEWRFTGATLSGNVFCRIKPEGRIDLLLLSSTHWLTLYRSSVFHYWHRRWRLCLTDGSHENRVYK